MILSSFSFFFLSILLLIDIKRQIMPGGYNRVPNAYIKAYNTYECDIDSSYCTWNDDNQPITICDVSIPPSYCPELLSGNNPSNVQLIGCYTDPTCNGQYVGPIVPPTTAAQPNVAAAPPAVTEVESDAAPSSSSSSSSSKKLTHATKLILIILGSILGFILFCIGAVVSVNYWRKEKSVVFKPLFI